MHTHGRSRSLGRSPWPTKAPACRGFWWKPTRGLEPRTPSLRGMAGRASARIGRDSWRRAGISAPARVPACPGAAPCMCPECVRAPPAIPSLYRATAPLERKHDPRRRLMPAGLTALRRKHSAGRVLLLLPRSESVRRYECGARGLRGARCRTHHVAPTTMKTTPANGATTSATRVQRRSIARSKRPTSPCRAAIRRRIPAMLRRYWIGQTRNRTPATIIGTSTGETSARRCRFPCEAALTRASGGAAQRSAGSHAERA
jgi:hypothetical protein